MLLSPWYAPSGCIPLDHGRPPRGPPNIVLAILYFDGHLRPLLYPRSRGSPLSRGSGHLEASRLKRADADPGRTSRRQRPARQGSRRCVCCRFSRVASSRHVRVRSPASCDIVPRPPPGADPSLSTCPLICSAPIAGCSRSPIIARATCPVRRAWVQIALGKTWAKCLTDSSRSQPISTRETAPAAGPRSPADLNSGA